MDKNNIILQSWYPIGHGNKELLNNDDIVEIGNKYNKSAVQVILRWHIQSGFIAIPKSTSPAHIKDNFDIFDFELSQEDMNKIEKLDTGKPSFIHNEEFGKQLLSWVVPE